ncbi:MAG: hypothetical protein ABW007_11105 [Chitinophagaceae bacterium]
MNNNQNERQQNICIYGGVFGVLIAATCLIQMMTYTRSHWIAYALLTIYTVSLFIFLFLALQKLFAPLMMIISTALSMISVTYIMIEGIYSLILIVHFLYSLAITIVIYMENIPALLKHRSVLKKQEELAWKDKI